MLQCVQVMVKCIVSGYCKVISMFQGFGGKVKNCSVGTFESNFPTIRFAT